MSLGNSIVLFLDKFQILNSIKAPIRIASALSTSIAVFYMVMTGKVDSLLKASIPEEFTLYFAIMLAVVTFLVSIAIFNGLWSMIAHLYSKITNQISDFKEDLRKQRDGEQLSNQMRNEFRKQWQYFDYTAKELIEETYLAEKKLPKYGNEYHTYHNYFDVIIETADGGVVVTLKEELAKELTEIITEQLEPIISEYFDNEDGQGILQLLEEGKSVKLESLTDEQIDIIRDKNQTIIYNRTHRHNTLYRFGFSCGLKRQVLEKMQGKNYHNSIEVLD